MKKILITGATGLVGSYILMEWSRQNYMEVKAIYRNKKSIHEIKKLFEQEGYSKNWNSITWVKASLEEDDILEELLRDTDILIHAAALVSFSPSDKKKLFETNVKGTERLINLALDNGISYFLHISSVAALGGTDQVKSEKSIWSWNAPHTHYGASKYLAEMEVWRGFEEGLRGSILNPSIVMGPGFWNKSFGKVVDMIYKEKLPFYTTGKTGYVDVRDIAAISKLLIDRNINKERFVVNAGHASFKEIAEILAGYLQANPPRRKIPEFALMLLRHPVNLYGYLTGKGKILDKNAIQSLFEDSYYDNSKIKKMLDFSFIPVEKSLEYIARKYLQAHKS